MGKEIVYCVGCGGRLTEDDFERRRAQSIENKPYCARCRPVTAPPPEPPPAESSRSAGRSTSARRRNSTSHLPRVTPPTTRRQGGPSGKRAVWIVAGSLAAVALVALIAMAAGSNRGTPVRHPESEPVEATRKPREEARPAAKDGLEERVRELESFAAGSIDPQAILLRCDAVRPGAKGTPLEERVKRVEARALELRQRDQDRDLDRFLGTIRKMMVDDPACEKRKEVEGMLDAALKIAGTRASEVQRLKEEYRARCEAAARPPEPPKPPARNWVDCFTLAGTRIQANDYPGAKPLYLEGLATLPQAPPADAPHLAHYVAGLYNIACIYAVEASALAGAPRKTAADEAFKYLDWSLRSGYARLRCPCHAQTGGLGHMAEDKDLDSLRLDPRYPELRKKYSN